MADNKKTQIEPKAVVARMKTACGLRSVKDMSHYVGYSSNAIQNAITRGSVPYEAAAIVARKTGKSLDWLMFGSGTAASAKKPQRVTKEAGESRPEPAALPAAKITVDSDILAAIIAGIESALAETGRVMTPDNKAHLVVTLVEIYADAQTPPSRDNIIRLVRSAS